MRTIRAYCAVDLAPGREVTLDGSTLHHLQSVLRVKAGDHIVLFNGREPVEADAQVVRLTRKKAILAISATREISRESDPPIDLIQAVSRSDRMDMAIRKSVELGVTRIIAATTERSPFRLKGKQLEKKLAHWRGIVISACEQCGRTVLPSISEPKELTALLEQYKTGGTRLLLMPEAQHSLADVSADEHRAFSLLVGPEGGLTDDENRFAESANFKPCHLGPRILRTETAGIAALAYLRLRHQ